LGLSRQTRSPNALGHRSLLAGGEQIAESVRCGWLPITSESMGDENSPLFGRDVGESVASAWERYRERVFESWRPVSEWLVERVDPAPGHVILELAAGPGETGFLLAERLAPHGRLISTDLAEAMVAAARRGAEARGLTNVEFRTVDAQAIDLPDASVDGVLCRFGLMLVPDPAKAFSEVRRVLRPGARLAYSVFSGPDRNPFLTLLVRAFLEHGHTLPGDPFGPGGPFSLADPETNRAMLEQAGFTVVSVEEMPATMHYETLDDYWEMQTAIGGPLAALAAALPREEEAAIKATLAAIAGPFERGGAYDMPCVAVGVAAT